MNTVLVISLSVIGGVMLLAMAVLGLSRDSSSRNKEIQEVTEDLENAGKADLDVVECDSVATDEVQKGLSWDSCCDPC